MSITSRLLGSGPGWQVSDVVCTAGPQDRAFEERHSFFSLALVTSGTFQYRTAAGRAVMMPNSVLLGNEGAAFECGHQHGHGDRCMAFQFSPEFLEPLVASMPGKRCMRFDHPRVPPLASLMPVSAAAQAMRDGREDGLDYEELAILFAEAVFDAAEGKSRASRMPSARDERRISAALRQIEAQPGGAMTLHRLAHDASSSPYHFLRMFRQVVGVTPGQYVLRSRLHHAALRLRTSDESVSSIALSCGFNDLSTFNRHFHRALGTAPTRYRQTSD